jgi:hypothetical protein
VLYHEITAGTGNRADESRSAAHAWAAALSTDRNLLIATTENGKIQTCGT